MKDETADISSFILPPFILDFQRPGQLRRSIASLSGGFERCPLTP